jgi:hypothetical protein
MVPTADAHVAKQQAEVCSIRLSVAWIAEVQWSQPSLLLAALKQLLIKDLLHIRDSLSQLIKLNGELCRNRR